MANRYWVGGAGNWSSTTKWSTSSGGASGASVPTSADDAIFDANSGGKFVATVDTAQQVNSLTITPSAGAGVLEIAITVSLTTGNLTTTGTAGNNRIWFRSTTYGISTNLIVNGTVSITDCDFRGLYVTGTSAPISGTRIGNRGECRGITFSTPKTVYWNLAAGGNWSANAWATSSGGAVSTDNFPLPQDTATIVNTGLNTFATIVLDSAIAYVSTVDMSGRTTSAVINVQYSPTTVYGSWKNSSSISLQATTSQLVFSGGSTQTITSAGVQFSNISVTVNTYGGTVQLADALNIGTGTLTVTNGTFDTKNFDVTASGLSSSNSNIRTITLGSSTVTLGVSSVAFSTSTNLTFNAGTSQVTISVNTSGTLTVSLGGLTYYNVTLTNVSLGALTFDVTGQNTFNNLTVAGTSASANIQSATFSANQTINGTLTCAGASAVRRVFLASGTIGTQRTITAAAISANNCDFRDINLAGAASGASPTRAGDCGGNSGITFPAPKTVYWNLAGAQNWSATGWAPSSGGTPDINQFPLAQDTAVFDNTGSVTGTITINSAWSIGTFDASARTSAMTLTTSTNIPTVYGDWKFGTGVTSSSTTGTITFAKNGTQTITSNGVQFGCNVTVNHPSGTVQLADALSLGATRTLTLTTGTFDAVTYNVTSGLFSAVAGTTLRMGTGTWTLSGTGPVWTGSGTTIVGTSTIVLSDTSTSSRSFNGGNLYYNKLTIGGTTGTSTLTITGANTFGELASTKTVAHTITFQTVLTAFIGKWSVTGTVGNVVTVNSNAAGTAFNLSIAGPANSGIDYLSIRDCTVTSTSPGEFYVGANSTNVSNNTRVIFTATPAPRTLYWRGGTGNWSATTSWDTVSGGAGPAAIPTSLDAVVFDSASNATAYTATIDAGVTLARCASFTMAGPLSGNVTFAGTVGIAFHGNVSFAATGITRTYTGDMQWAGNGSYTFTTNGLTLGSACTVIGIGSTWALGSAINTSSITVTNGTFSTSASNYSITSGSAFTSNNSNVRTVSLNGSTLTLSTLNSAAFGYGTTTNLTFTAGTSQINLSGSTTGISSGGLTFNNVSFTSAAAASIIITGANTFTTLSFAGRTTVGITPVTFNANQTISTLTLNAGTAAAYRTFLASNTLGTQRTLTVTTLTAGAADYDFRDIAIVGGAAPISGTRFGDAKGNSGITFPAAKTVYYRQTGSANWGATGTGSWSATSGGALDATQFPLAQDTAIFPAATYPASGSTTTVNASYNIGTIDMSLRTTNTMTLGTGSITPQIYGNWINGTGTTLTGSAGMTFAGRSSQTITSAGKTFTQAFVINTPAGSVTLQDAFETSSGVSPFTLTAGTFDANIYNFTISTTASGAGFSSSTSNTRTIAVGTGTWVIAASGTAWNATTSTNLTVTGTGTISLTSASTKTFAGSVSYTGVTLNQGGAGTLNIIGNNTFKDITNTYSATGATTVSLNTTTQTVTNFTGTGAATRVLTLSGTSAASPATLVITGSVGVGTDYINVSNVRGYPLTDSWKIGVNSTNAGSLGFIFVAASGNIYNSSVSETSTAADAIAGGFLFLASVQELLTIIDQTFAAASFSTTASETAVASETVSALGILVPAISETATASDAQSAIASFRGSASESATASETTTVAASTFGATSAETATAQDSVDAPGSTYNPSTSETVQALDTPSAAATFPVATSETATIADQNAAAFTAATNISESATAADITAALVAFAALTAENASASDQTLVVPSTFNAIAAAAAQAFDSVDAPGSIYNAAVVNTAVALDSIIGAFLWNLIDDSQGTGWTTIATRIAFSGTWAAAVVTPSAALMFNTTVDAGYLRATSTTTLTNTLPYGGYYVCSAYVNGYIYAFNFATNLYPPIRSVDGLTWELVNRPLTNHAIIAVFGNGTQLGIIQNSRAYVSTDNGATWTAGSTGFPPTSSYGEAVWDGTRYSMIIGPLRRTSTDGLTWTTNSNVGVGYDKGFIAWNGATYVTLRTSYTASFAFQSVVGISTNGVTYSTVPNTTDSSTAAVLGIVNNEFFLINESGKVLKLDTTTSTYTAVGQVPSTTLPRALLAVFKFGQFQGEVYVSGVRNFANDTYLTTTDFVTYTTNQLSIWTGIDDNQSPNWQNISNS